MSIIKNKRIKLYLETKDKLSTFDNLLSEYILGNLHAHLEKLMLNKIKIHIDWLPDYKCIEIQSKFKNYYFEIQIEEKEFSISYDKDEADEPIVYVLESSEQFYNTIDETLMQLM